MLVDLQDVFAYTDEQARATPEIAAEIILRRRGDLGAELEKVSHDLALPPIYKDCVARIGMFGVSIGYFNLWPGARRVKNMVDALYQANNGQGQLNSAMRESRLIYVASEESNRICVGAAGQAGADVVDYIDVTSSPRPTILKIAPNFEKFMILAANLNEISLSNEGNQKRAALLMTQCCKALGCEGLSEFWRRSAVELSAS